jgi:hypothetical protein
MLFRIVPAALLAWLAMFPASTAAQPIDRARLMGAVTDASGGALPGVTVVVSGGNERPAPVVTDGAGRYLTAWLAPGAYNITFSLPGFETRIVNKVQLAAGQTVVLDQRLGLAPLTETVEVTAVAPVPLPPPAPPAFLPPRTAPVPRPEAKPVDKELLASLCGPRQSVDFTVAIGKVVSRSDDPERRLIGPGDLLRIDAGETKGVVSGQNLVVRRRFQTGDLYAPKKQQTFGEQTAGLVQVVETTPESSVALVVHSCGEIVAGDSVEPYAAQPAFFAVSAGTPYFDDPARITTGEHGAQVAAAGQMMVIDRGILRGVQRGQRLTIFRASPGNPGLKLTIGDGVIVAIRADSATIKIEKTTAAVMVGDLVALHR